MVTKGIVKKGEYFDSVSLMMIVKQVNQFSGVIDSAVVMGTPENKAILKSSLLLIPQFKNTDDTDLLIAVKAQDKKNVEKAINAIDKLLKEKTQKTQNQEQYIPKSFEKALEIFPKANLTLISVSGKYAYQEALKSLENNIHVMIFSDNVSLDHEIQLKRYALKKGLLVMGPDCGTAIINEAPLGFANVVNKGKIGIVAASGTGLQEVSCIISNKGEGISQAIGTGGRDVKKDVKGMMFISALKALNTDMKTKIITLISKPPHEQVLQSIMNEAKKIKKPIVAVFLGGNPRILKSSNIIFANSLEEAGLISVALSKGTSIENIRKSLVQREQNLDDIAKREVKKKSASQKYIRGLYCGGTLCDEAQIILKDMIGSVYSNTPINSKYLLKDSLKSKEHTIIDLGEDEFTMGRPHPMIDFSLRNMRIIQEAEDPKTAVLLLDIVLGYGSNPEPGKEITPAIKQAFHIARKKNRHLSIICSITGTNKDPQNKHLLIQSLLKTGVLIVPSNASASQLAGKIIKSLRGS